MTTAIVTAFLAALVLMILLAAFLSLVSGVNDENAGADEPEAE